MLKYATINHITNQYWNRAESKWVEESTTYNEPLVMTRRHKKIKGFMFNFPKNGINVRVI